MKRLMQLGLIMMASLVLITACQSPSSPQPTNVASVTIVEGSVLLTTIGATQKLTAKVLDDASNTVTATVIWESSNPDVAKVNADGTIEGLKVGSTQLRAKVGDKVSAPIIAAVATLNSDIKTIEASNIVSGPIFIGVTEGQAISVGSQYTVVVQNLSPTVGAKWFSQGKDEQRLQGQIIKVEDQEDGRKLVTLEVVPYEDIFTALSIDEEVDYSQTADDVPPGFDPEALTSQVFVGVGALECELSGVGGTPPISLGVPAMSIGFSTDTARTGIRVNIGFDQANTVLVRFKGNLDANLLMTGRINRNFSGSVDCRTRNPINRNIVNIPLPLFTGLTSERGLGVKLSGDFSGPTTTFSANGRLGVAFDMGASLNLSSGEITRFNTVTPTPNGLLLINQTTGITTFDASAEAYVFDNWIMNAPGVAFDLWEDRNGIRSVARMISVSEQITSGQRASYRLERAGRNGPGAEFRAFLRFFNARELLPPTRTYTDVIRATPFTLGSFSCIAATGSTTRANCNTTFSQRTFPVVNDNILKIEVWARTGSFAPRKVGETSSVASATITTNNLPVTTGDQCFLAVVTKTMPFAAIVAATDTNCLQ